LSQNVSRAVGRSVVDDQNLLLDTIERNCQNLVEQLLDSIAFVVSRDNYRELQGNFSRSSGSAPGAKIH
jgi:hypothetical protein